MPEPAARKAEELKPNDQIHAHEVAHEHPHEHHEHAKPEVVEPTYVVHEVMPVVPQVHIKLDPIFFLCYFGILSNCTHFPYLINFCTCCFGPQIDLAAIEQQHQQQLDQQSEQLRSLFATERSQLMADAQQQLELAVCRKLNNIINIPLKSIRIAIRNVFCGFVV